MSRYESPAIGGVPPAAIVAADAGVDGPARGRYGDVLKSAFIRHGILSIQSDCVPVFFSAAKNFSVAFIETRNALCGKITIR